MFVLPHENVTSKYLRKPSEDEEQDEVDIVPFPKNWKLRNARLRVPAFNTTDVDQYGSELEQVSLYKDATCHFYARTKICPGKAGSLRSSCFQKLSPHFLFLYECASIL